MKIFFFEIDEHRILVAGFSVGGKRYIRPIWSQGGQSYVMTGAAVTKDRKRHNFTEAQEAALNAFLDSDEMSVDIPGGC